MSSICPINICLYPRPWGILNRDHWLQLWGRITEVKEEGRFLAGVEWAGKDSRAAYCTLVEIKDANLDLAGIRIQNLYKL